MSRILIADDDPLLRNTLRIAFTSDAYELVEAEDSDDALERFSADKPDLVVLDVSMPGLDGFSVCQRIRSESSVPILMLTGRQEVEDKVRGLQRGADDYLAKPFAVEELMARVKALLRRSAPPVSQTLAFADLTLEADTHIVRRGGEQVHLSPHEFLLLQFFMENPRQVLSRAQLCREVWGYDFGGESNFIDVTVKSLRQKLEANDAPRLIQTVRGFGYSLRESPV